MGESTEIGTDRLEAAHRAVAGVVHDTPILASRACSAIAGGRVVLKAENLQLTGSFKVRGALAKLAALGPLAAAGVVTGSAGNHAQALAYAARLRGVPCVVVMPRNAPVAKAEAAAGYGATVHQVGGTLEDAVADARERAAATGATFVHPFDDPDVVAGQATLGRELLTQVPDLSLVVVPVGGGGLASGVATAVRRGRPGVRIVGVRASAVAAATADAAWSWAPVTLADGIAVKHPSALTAGLLATLVDEIVDVGEAATAEAIALLLGRGKLLVEGAGAVGVAALIDGVVTPPAGGATAIILSGGNIDPTTLMSVVRWTETRAGRRLILTARVEDRPGHLADLLTIVGRGGGNLVEVHHLREGVDLGVRATGVELVIETRGAAHSEQILADITAAGYSVDLRRPGGPAPPPGA